MTERSHIDVIDVRATVDSIHSAQEASLRECAELVLAHHRATAPRATGHLADDSTVRVEGYRSASVVAPEDRSEAVVSLRRRGVETIFTAPIDPAVEAECQTSIDVAFSAVSPVVGR